MLTGRLAPTTGQVLLGGEDVTRLAQSARVKRGLGRTFQINTLFRDLTVLDNVALGVRGAARRRRAAVAAGFGLSRSARRIDGVPREPRASPRTRAQRVLDLPYGKQRLVEIAIALGLKPSVLLLDEPAAGVPSHESERILEVLDRLPAEIAILIIEHDMDLVFRFAKPDHRSRAGAGAVSRARRTRSPPTGGCTRCTSGKGGAWLRRSGSTACAPGTARPSCSRTSDSPSPSAARSRCSDGTASARRRSSPPSWATRPSIRGTWRFAASRSRGCRRTSATAPASATCRRRGRCFRRCRSRRTSRSPGGRGGGRSSVCTSSSPVSRSGARTWATRSRAASSRCSPSGGR